MDAPTLCALLRNRRCTPSPRFLSAFSKIYVYLLYSSDVDSRNYVYLLYSSDVDSRNYVCVVQCPVCYSALILPSAYW
jgi:hypothetical protein